MSKQRITVLVVDDEPGNIDLVAGILKARYKVKVATGGGGALQIAAKSPPPDLILLDVMMPGMSGIEVCRALGDSDASRSIPVIFISGDQPEHELAAYGEQVAAWLTKPVIAETLLAEVSRALSGSQLGVDGESGVSQ